MCVVLQIFLFAYLLICSFVFIFELSLQDTFVRLEKY